jgi:hypothetical protein
MEVCITATKGYNTNTNTNTNILLFPLSPPLSMSIGLAAMLLRLFVLMLVPSHSSPSPTLFYFHLWPILLLRGIYSLRIQQNFPKSKDAEAGILLYFLDFAAFVGVAGEDRPWHFVFSLHFSSLLVLVFSPLAFLFLASHRNSIQVRF